MKLENNCPKCGAKEDWTPYQNWACGSNGNVDFDQSDLCETRQEKLIACELNEALAEDFAEMQASKEKFEAEVHDLKKQILGMWNYQTRAELAEAELAKREKALDEAVRHIACFCAPMAEEDTATALAHDLIRRCADESPELAEWLQGRSV
jgi:hypothetical protein